MLKERGWETGLTSMKEMFEWFSMDESSDDRPPKQQAGKHTRHTCSFDDLYGKSSFSCSEQGIPLKFPWQNLHMLSMTRWKFQNGAKHGVPSADVRSSELWGPPAINEGIFRLQSFKIFSYGRLIKWENCEGARSMSLGIFFIFFFYRDGGGGQSWRNDGLYLLGQCTSSIQS